MLKSVFPILSTNLVQPLRPPVRLLSDRAINRQLLPIWLLFGLGLGLRFANLALKPVWLDEAFTLFHISGFTDALARQQIVTGQPISVHELLNYQQPNLLHNVWNTIQNIADRAPELPPLYFILLYLWMKLLGSSIMVIRSLSVLISLAILPATYWLAMELFSLPIVGWYAMTLISVSPFHLNLAQEIRPYSLWTVCFLASSALFLRAQRLQRWRDWLGFGVAMLAGLYTHLFMVLPWFVYGIHTLVMSQGQFTRNLKRFVATSSFITLGFLPWLWLGYLRSVDRPDIFVKPHSSQFGIIKGILQGIGRFFLDFSLNETSSKVLVMSYGLGLFIVLGLAIYSFIYLQQGADTRQRWFLGLMTAIPIGLFIISDLLTNASRSAFTRYYVPSAIAIEIMIAYLMAAKQTSNFQVTELWQRWQRRWIALLLVGACSCGWFAVTPNWWSKTKTEANACLVNTTAPIANPLVITDEYYVRSLGLAHQLGSSVKFQFYPVKSKAAPSLEPLAQPTYLFMPSDGFLQAIQDRYQVQLTCAPHVWQVKSAESIKS